MISMNEKEQLTERKKELNCIYRIDKLVEEDLDVQTFLMATTGIIADGFQYPCYISVFIELEDIIIRSPYYREGRNFLISELKNKNKVLGKICVFYSDKLEQNNPFLEEEQHLLDSVSKRVSDYLLIDKIENAIKETSVSRYVETRQKILSNAVMSANFPDLGLYSIYVIGSVKEHTSGISSDIDLILYYNGSKESMKLIKLWFEAWSESVLKSDKYTEEISGLDNLFDLHFITDIDIEKKTSYAVMINALHNRAKLIKTIL